jgi:hypothetical protein
MKRLFLFLAIALSVGFYNSCTKDKVAAAPDCTQADSVNTYTNSVKPIFDTYCALGGCHFGSSSQDGVQLDTYEGSVKAARSDTKFFCVIDHTCMPYMPDQQAKLADSLITKIQAWKTNCYAQ